MRFKEKVGKGCGAELAHSDLIVAMSPPDYPSARLRPRRAGFRFTRPIQFRPITGHSPVNSGGFGKKSRIAS
jgi:hypothetical protein